MWLTTKHFGAWNENPHTLSGNNSKKELGNEELTSLIPLLFYGPFFMMLYLLAYSSLRD